MNLSYKNDKLHLRSGGGRGGFNNAPLTMNWVQYTDDEGDVVVHSGEGDILSEDALIYDADNIYAGTETVEEWVFDFTLPEVNEGAVDETRFAAYQGEQTLEIKYTPDNIETGESEERWAVYHNGFFLGQYNNQVDSESAFEQQKQLILDNWELVKQKQVEANAQAEKDKEWREKNKKRKVELPADFGSIVLGVGMIGIALVIVMKVMSKKSTGEGSNE